ncbi:hypothetical protein BD626DRAFT_536134 [Schizophyllum amplum]|uniref:Uncharacterized protein n=1 Tax=Schizophyllum amplum TaxID=97359 RepID=A0A550CJH8_9AGAR|nr:hypothetical protein BD626DRAFT_536134 [Auriculariopsis ampla]
MLGGPHPSRQVGQKPKMFGHSPKRLKSIIAASFATRLEVKHGARKKTTRYSSKTSTGVLRNHLLKLHTDAWIAACDKFDITIMADSAQPAVRKYRRQGQAPLQPTVEEGHRQAFSKEAFVDAICAWIAGDDQSINVIESLLLRNIFLLLREELKDNDIPGRAKFTAPGRV